MAIERTDLRECSGGPSVASDIDEEGDHVKVLDALKAILAVCIINICI
jgi:hypothetical protein